MDQYFDPAATLSPDDPLRALLGRPELADIVTRKAIEHAGNVLGYTDPMGSVSGITQDDPKTPLPTPRPVSAPPRDEDLPVYVMDKGPPTGITPKGSTPPFDDRYPPANAFDPTPDGVATPAESGLPRSRPRDAGPGASDLSGKKKGDLEGATNDFAKMAAGVKAIQPPPVNPVGTPQLPHHNAIQAAQVSQLLQLMGAQSRPDPIQTLGRLLVSGKA